MTHDANITPSDSALSAATRAALEALAWSETDESGEPLDGLGLVFNAESVALVRSEVDEFLTANSTDLDGLDYGQIGHDITLTRNGHGSGFWDRGLGERGERLTASAHVLGNLSAFVTEDGTALHAERI